MKNKFKILKVLDKTDNYTVRKNNIFDLSFRVLLCAKSGMGKTTLITNFLLNPNFYLNDFKSSDIWIISPSLKNDPKLAVIAEEKEIDETHLMTEYNDARLKEIYDDIESDYNKDIEDGKKPKNKLIIMDDLGFSGALASKSKKIQQINRIACNGRHVNLSLLVCIQSYAQANNVLRSNLNGLIIFDTSKKILDDIASENNYVFNKDSEFIKCFRDNVQNKTDFMVINFTNDKKEMLMNSEFEPIDIDKYKSK